VNISGLQHSGVNVRLFNTTGRKTTMRLGFRAQLIRIKKGLQRR